MKAIIYIHSRDERALLRPIVAQHFDNVYTATSPQDLRAELAKPQKVDALILDELCDKAKELNHAQPDKILDILYDLQMGQFPSAAECVPFVILGEDEKEAASQGDKDQERFAPLVDRRRAYSEQGVDLFTERPMKMEDFAKVLAAQKVCVQNPPAWFTAMNKARELLRDKKYAEAQAIVEPVYSAIATPSLGLALLYANTLVGQEGAPLKKGVDVLKGLTKKYPKSIGVRKMLGEAQEKNKRMRAAFYSFAHLYTLQRTKANFERMFALSQKLLGKWEKKQVADMDLRSHKIFSVLVEALSFKHPKLNQSERLEVFKYMESRTRSFDSIQSFVQMVSSHDDIKANLREPIHKIMERLERQGINEVNKYTYVMVLKNLLDIEAGYPKAIEKFVQLELELGEESVADDYLKRAEDSKKNSLELCLAGALLALQQKRLKDASDYLHKGGRFDADNPRLQSMRAQWSKLYQEKQAKDAELMKKYAA